MLVFSQRLTGKLEAPTVSAVGASLFLFTPNSFLSQAFCQTLHDCRVD